MNTVLKFPTFDKTVVTNRNLIVNRGVVWIISTSRDWNPGLHKVSRFNKALNVCLTDVQISEDEYDYIYTGDSGDIEAASPSATTVSGRTTYWRASDPLPREIETIARSLESQGWTEIFWITFPPEDFSSLHLVRGVENEPILAQTGRFIGKEPYRRY